MRVSYSLLLVLAQEGDTTAHAIISAFGAETGVLWEPQHLQVYYQPVHDYLVMHVSDGRMVAAPARWDCPFPSLTLSHPLIDDRSWFQKGR